MGTIITFYSYKGGVGRTMALANVAVLLCKWGYRVLIVDWDLEAPGLEFYFKEYLDLDTVLKNRGIIDLLSFTLNSVSEKLDWKELIVPISFPDFNNSLDLLTAGKRDNEDEYFHKVRNLDIEGFYSERDGGDFIELLRNGWSDTYDYILLDSRTGITDIGGICTIQMPDVLVLMFTATEQGLKGIVRIAGRVDQARQELPYDRFSLISLPIPSRFDTAEEFKIGQEWLEKFSEHLSEIYASWLHKSVARRDFLEVTKIPYISYFSFGEKLPVLEQGTLDPAGLGYAYETLSALLANKLENTELLLKDRSNFARIAKQENIVQTPPQNLPNRTKQFVGREDVMKNLHQELQANEQVYLQGMGGIGKTELALQYAWQHYEQGTYPAGLCWLRAREQDLGTQIVNFGRIQLQLLLPEGLDLFNQVAYCWRHWQEGDTLIILDDVTDYESIDPYLPPADPRFKVLLTTRLQLGRSVRSFPIELLDEPAALALLRSLVGNERIDQQLEAAKALCAWLGYLPLGLELVGRYLDAKPDLSLPQMQQRLQAKRLAATALEEPGPGMTARLGVAAAFELSWQELAEPARQLSYLLSLFALAPIPWELVKSCLSDWDAEDLEDTRDQELVNRSLVQRVGENLYQLHQLVREFFRTKLEIADSAAAWKHRYCDTLIQVAQQIPQVPTQDLILEVTPTVPHLAELATTLNPWVSDEDLGWAFWGIARFYQGQGDYAQAQPYLEQCVAKVRDQLGEDHPNVASSLNNLAGLYYSQGRYGAAEPLYEQALALSRRVLGEDHPDVASSLNNLAALYQAEGHYGAAEPLYEQALALRQQLLGENHPDVAASLNNLAALYESQGRYREAEPLYEQALALRQQLLGKAHPAVATSLNNLAGLYQSQGRYGAAEPLYEQTLALRQQLLGKAHPAVATSLNNLAYLYESQGRYRESEPLYEQALALYRQVLGEAHPAVATSLNNLAGLYDSQGRYGEAQLLYEQALALRRRVLGEDHPDVATSLNNLAGLYNSQERYGEAELLYEQALALWRRVLGEDHPTVATSLDNLAGLYDSQGRYDEAEPLYMRALDIADRKLGSDHPNTVTVRNNLNALRDRWTHKSLQQ